MSSESIIRLQGVSKCYQIYARPQDRLKQFLLGSRRAYYREFWALRDVHLEVLRGDVVGIIGRNGAGKSTLLQIVCGTLAPSLGCVQRRGRVAALLELGAGFNPEFSGRDNVILSATILGLTDAEIRERYQAIVEFAEIGDFIDQPVKTYSSGMYVRLAFSVAIAVDPEILVIDEALSVGDGEFARKSFERVMELKARGTTILFCSHSTYQIEALCNRAVWLHEGRIQMTGEPDTVVMAYNAFLDTGQPDAFAIASAAVQPATAPTPSGSANVTSVQTLVDGRPSNNAVVLSGSSELSVRIDVAFDPALPMPTVAVMLLDAASKPLASNSTLIDGYCPELIGPGRASVQCVYPALPLLKGVYTVDVWLFCERGVRVHQHLRTVARLEVRQDHLEVGVIHLPHHWVSLSN